MQRFIINIKPYSSCSAKNLPKNKKVVVSRVSHLLLPLAKLRSSARSSASPFSRTSVKTSVIKALESMTNFLKMDASSILTMLVITMESIRSSNSQHIDNLSDTF